MNTMSRPDLPVVVIGAGPVGLAAAAHLVERGLRPLVLERGENVGGALGGGQLAGDRTAAREVRLVLPETGVCNSDPTEAVGRSEERRVGDRGGRTCRSRGAPDHR